MSDKVATERARVSNQNGRAKKKGGVGTLKLREWIEILDEYRWKCAYCGGKFEVMEHVVPIVLGGSTEKSNVVPACNVCNMAKGRHTEFVVAEPGVEVGETTQKGI